MADAIAHGKVALSAVLAGGGSVKALDYVRVRLTPEHFADEVQRKLLILLQRYADATGGVPTREGLADLLRDQPPGTALRYGEVYDALAARAPELHAFKHSVDQLRELTAARKTEEAFAQGTEILRNGARLVDGTELRGHAAARAWVLAAFAEAERAGGVALTPEGNALAEGDDILDAYAKTKALRLAGHLPGVRFGLPRLDAFLGTGLLDGEMATVMASTTIGKSSLCVQCGWHNAVQEGKNVVFFTTEQLRTSLRIKIVARHSRLPKFGLARGLNSADIRAGRLTEEEERIFAWVLDDLKTGGYGQLNVVQLPEVATVSGMSARYASIRRQYKVDLVVVDYLQLFTPERASRESRQHENQSGIVKAAAAWCRSVDDGAGVPLITPWQANGDGVNAQKASGRISLEHSADTREASKTPSVVLALTAPEEDTSNGRHAQLRLEVLKNRDGGRNKRFDITADYATNYFSDRQDESAEDLLDLGE
jgi:replicative DNA helicase